MEVFDISGRIIQKNKIPSTGYFSFNRNNAAAGIYMFRIVTENENIEHTGRLIWE
ncbi:MAG: T9SS type A sorting domain-containing protein [Chitinophagales bacterium]